MKERFCREYLEDGTLGGFINIDNIVHVYISQIQKKKNSFTILSYCLKCETVHCDVFRISEEYETEREAENKMCEMIAWWEE